MFYMFTYYPGFPNYFTIFYIDDLVQDFGD